MVALFEQHKTCSGRQRDGSKCQGAVRFTSTTLCEDCWARVQARWRGNNQRVRLERDNQDDQ
jgi:hypothetical protein